MAGKSDGKVAFITGAARGQVERMPPAMTREGADIIAVDAAWDEFGEYLLHDAMAYAEWNPDNTVSANISTATTVDELRRAATTHGTSLTACPITAIAGSATKKIGE